MSYSFQLEIPVDIDTEFCDINANGCVSTQPSCNERGAGGGIQEFCSCSTLDVPAYAPVGLFLIELYLQYSLHLILHESLNMCINFTSNVYFLARWEPMLRLRGSS